MQDSTFQILQQILMEKSGLSLTQQKIYLLESRLNPVAKKHGFDNLDTLANTLKTAPARDLITEVVEAMTTNETSFFRDMHPFEVFKTTILPHILEKNAATKKCKIWCAASSTGQEPYSLAMTIKEEGAKLAGWDFQITATDISIDVVEQAKAGTYSQFEVQRGMPIMMLMKYFEQVDEKWVIKDDIKKMVQYKYFNLLDTISALGKFDLILCRNVLIYFDKETKKKVLDQMVSMIPADGHIFLGGSETVLGVTDTLKPVPGIRGVFQPAPKS